MRLRPIVATLAVLALSVPLAHAENEEAASLVVHPVRAGIHRLEASTPFGATVNMVAFAGPDGILLVDTGLQADTSELERTLAKLDAGDARLVIDTHSHGDHTGGNRIWGARAVVIGSEQLYRDLTTGAGLLRELPAYALPTVTFSDGLTLHFNGDTVKVLALPGGHSTSDAVVHFTAADVWAMGGMVYADAFPFVDVKAGCTPERLIANLQRVLDAADEQAVFVTGHGRDLSRADLAAYVKMLETTTGVVAEAVAAGKTADEIVEAGLLKDWSAWQGPFVSTAAWVKTIARSRTPVEPDTRRSLVDPLYAALKTGDANAAIAVYRDLKANHRDEYAFVEQTLNAIGYYLLGKDRVDDAVAILALNVEEYPDAFNTYDSLGEAYLAKGNKELAVRYYRKSLELNPDNQNAEKKLQEIGVED